MLLKHGVAADEDAAAVLRSKGATGREALLQFNRILAGRDAEEAIAAARGKWRLGNKWVDKVLAAGSGATCRRLAECAATCLHARTHVRR